jgi:ATP-dependent Clp protease ATP-binding subunit ClpC
VLHASQEALDQLASEGYDPDMGARPLRRVIQQKVEDPLSDALLSGDFEDGDVILVDLVETDGEKKITLHREETETLQPEIENVH